MKNLRAFWIVILLASTLTGCVFGDGGMLTMPTSTPDPLHVPVQKPTDESTPVPSPQVDIYRGTPPSEVERSITNGIRCDLNGDNVCNNADVRLLNADISATQNAPRATATTRPSATARPASATPASTSTRAPTPTLVAMSTATVEPTATTVPPSEAACLNCVDITTIQHAPQPVPNVRGLACPAWVHDQYLVSIPDGTKLIYYRTWHPQVQPDNTDGAGCYFDHEHGSRDPRGSHANPTLPAYGYEADKHGMAEPHNGFKTEYANRGECNQLEGFCATSDTSLTIHMGTASAGRLKVEFHTFVFDLIGDRGSVVHVRGMASTGDPDTQCDNQKFTCPDGPDTSGPRGFRLLAMPRDQALARGITTPYEVWQFHFAIGDNIINSKFATFDGITVARRNADGKTFTLEQTSLTWPNAPFSSCKHDVYFGGFTLHKNIDLVDAQGFRQYVHIGDDDGHVVLDTSEWHKDTYKAPFDGCDAMPDGVVYTNN